MWGALLGAGLSLFGAKKQADAEADAIAAANKANTPLAQRKAYEKAGINPLFGMSSGSYIPQQASSASIGDSFAQAGSILQQGLELDHSQRIAETQVSQENEILRKKLDEMSTLTPSNMQLYGDLIPQQSSSMGDDPSIVNSIDEGYTDYRFAGSDFMANRSFSDAEVIEARHGDLVGSVYGVNTLIADGAKKAVDAFEQSNLFDTTVDFFDRRTASRKQYEEEQDALMEQMRSGDRASNADLLFGDFYYHD